MLSPLVTETDVRYKLGLRESNLSVPRVSQTSRTLQGGEARRARERNTSKEGSFRHATRVTRAKLVTRQVTIYIDLLLSSYEDDHEPILGFIKRDKIKSSSLSSLFSIDQGESHFNRFVDSSFPGSFNSCVPKLFLSLSILHSSRKISPFIHSVHRVRLFAVDDLFPKLRDRGGEGDLTDTG